MIKTTSNFLLLFVLMSFFAAHAKANNQISLETPRGTWFHWIQAIRTDAKLGLPGRPDQKALPAPLPTWVDCHLSWYWSQPKVKKSKISSRLVFESGPEECKGQLEEWSS